jgi:hypothetical protein
MVFEHATDIATGTEIDKIRELLAQSAADGANVIALLG